ncbi:NAD(P)-dependent oxidoreductase [Paenarthrobacter sp. NPDC089675]
MKLFNPSTPNGSEPEEVRPAVGFLGPGAMGAGMVSRLLAEGYEVHIWARRPSKAQRLVDLGAVMESSPADVVSAAPVVIGCLLDSDVIRELYLGPSGDDGIVAHARAGQVFIEHATFDPGLALEISRSLGQRGAAFLDAPVSGGPSGALAGTLVSMVGGSTSTLRAVASILGSYCAKLKHAGEIGSGLRLKLINQLLVSVHAVAAAEASALAINAGIDGKTAHDALMGGWAASTMLDLQMPKAYAADFSSGGASTGGLLEVQRLVSEMISQSGTSSELLGPVRKVFQSVSDSGHADDGFSALLLHYLGEDATIRRSAETALQ